MKVFIIGKLGEVIKKVFELEETIREFPKNKLLLTELACYQEVLSMWPVEDRKDLDIPIAGLKYSLAKLKMCEAEFTKEVNTAYLPLVANNYLSALKQARNSMKMLNDMGKWIGPFPYLTIEDIIDAEHPSDDSTDAVNTER